MDRWTEKIFLEDNYKIYLDEVLRKPLLKKEEEEQLIQELKTNPTAKEKLIEANLRFVIKIAKKYVKKDISIMDLIQEGNLGLQFAVDNFDASKNVRFLTYAFYYIRKFIVCYLYEKRRNIRLPEEMIEDIYRYKKTYSYLYEKNDRIPSLEEIAKEMHVSLNRVKTLYFLLDDSKSINEIIKKDNNRGKVTERSYFIDNGYDLENEIIKKDFNSQVNYLINNSNLSEREKTIIIKRFGFDGEILNLEEIGDLFNVTKERIRQLENNALKKLNNSENINCLEEYVNEKQLRK